MPPVIIPNAVQLTLLWSDSGREWVNVIHLRKFGGFSVTQVTADQINAAVVAALQDDPVGPATSFMDAFLATDAGYRGLILTDISVANGPQFFSSGETNLTGFAGEVLPRDVAFVVTLRTALRSRRGRGRVFFGGAGLLALDSGLITQVAADAAVHFLEELNGALVALGASTAVASRADLVVRDVTAFDARDLRWDTQRRRDR